MGEFVRIVNDAYLMKASTMMEHTFINAFPPFRQDQIRTATLREVENRPEVLWDARWRFPPRFSTDQDEHDMYINYRPFDGHPDADLAFAQRLQDSIDQKDAVVYSKRNLQMQEDAEYAKTLAEEPVNKKMTRAADSNSRWQLLTTQYTCKICWKWLHLYKSSKTMKKMTMISRWNLPSWNSWKKLSTDNHMCLVTTKITFTSMDQNHRDHQLKHTMKTLNDVDPSHLIKQRLPLPDQTSAKNGK